MVAATLATDAFLLLAGALELLGVRTDDKQLAESIL
jgi:hypothetical protein